MDLREISHKYYYSDIIYHYTSKNTAIKYILHSNQVRLAPRSQSFDPIEKIKKIPSASSYGEENHERSKISSQVLHELSGKLGRVKQACFCKNHIDTSNRFNIIDKDDDDLGFLKPRMWDQYGDHYKGICIAFSLSKLKENNRSIVSKDINYISYNELKSNTIGFDENRLDFVTLDDFRSKIEESLLSSLTLKHKDYEHENEHRFITYSEEENIYLDTLNCVVGIFV